MPLVTGSVALGGSTLEYRYKAGNRNQPVLLLHPWFGCWQFWRRTMAALAGPCVAVDWYSIGKGAWQPYASPVALAVALMALMDELKYERCTVIGNSMGGISAQVLACMSPQRVAELVLVGTGASTSGAKPEFMAGVADWMADPQDRQRCTEMVLRLLSRSPSQSELGIYVSALVDANKQFMSNVLQGAWGLDLRSRLGQITARTLVVRGEQDAARTPEHVRDLLHGIRNSRAVEIPGAGHSPMVDSFDHFIDILHAFMKDQEGDDP